MGLKLPYKVKDIKTTQKNFDYIATNLFLGRQGYSRWPCVTNANAAQTGWTFVPSSQVPNDPSFFELGTPPGTPGGVAAAANSGVRIKQAGIYRIIANLLCEGATAAGRYDAYLSILNSAGAVGFYGDQFLVNVPAGSAHVKFSLACEVLIAAGGWVWPQNVTAPTYGDGGGAWSHMEIRYMGK